jgi:hypothetical protein
MNVAPLYPSSAITTIAAEMIDCPQARTQLARHRLSCRSVRCYPSRAGRSVAVRSDLPQYGQAELRLSRLEGAIEAGGRARNHDARHTAATVLLALEVSKRTVMGVMGCSSTSMAARYRRPITRTGEARAVAPTCRISCQSFRHSARSGEPDEPPPRRPGAPARHGKGGMSVAERFAVISATGHT